jgi:hypothetical protein
MTLADFLSTFKVKSSCRKGKANEYQCSVQHGKHSLGLVLQKAGKGEAKPPTGADVIASLAVDAAGYEGAKGDFSAWVKAMGADPNCPCSKRAFGDIRKQSRKLRRMLGDEGYRKLVAEAKGGR